MNASRLAIALAVLVGFVGGIGVGMFLGGGPGSVEPAVRSPAAPEPVVAQTSTGAVSDARGHERLQTEPEPAGEELHSRLWAALTIADENARHREWLGLLPSLTSADAAQVRELFRQLKAQGRRFDFEWSTFWPRWGELDGDAAIRQVSAGEAADVQAAAAGMVLRGWAKTDSESARAWLAANSSVPFYGAALRGYLDGLARRDLARATQDALALGQGRDMSEFVETLAEQALEQRQLDGMLEWWRTLPDDQNEGSTRIAAVSPVLSRLMDADPTRAQAWLTELAATPYRNDGSIGSFAARMAEADPPSAVAWVISLPPSSDGHYTGIGRTLRAWSAKDKASADRWVASLPPSPVREQAIAAQQQEVLGLDVLAVDAQRKGVIQFFQSGTKMQIDVSPGASGTIELFERK